MPSRTHTHTRKTRLLFSAADDTSLTCSLALSPSYTTQASFARVHVAIQSMSDLRTDDNVWSLAGMAMASLAVLLSSLEYVGCRWEATMGLILSLLSVILSVLGYYLVDKKKLSVMLKKVWAITLVIIWVLALFVLTFDAPFERYAAHCQRHLITLLHLLQHFNAMHAL